MKARALWAVLAIGLLAGALQAAVVVETATNASALERLAAQEVQRYVYLRMGELPAIGSSREASHRIIVARKDRALVNDSFVQKASEGLGQQEYLLRTTSSNGRKTWWVIGGDDLGTLYGAYRLAEALGVRFYLHGDVIPDGRLKALPDISETGKPLFSIRGIQPFHDFPEGPDWWNTDDYLTYITQLPKMRMNFIGLHCYPEGGAGPEPSVWIGLPKDMDERGRVSFSSPSHWANTARAGAWGYAAMPTSEFCAGASLLFPEEQYGPDVMGGILPRPVTPEQCNNVFNRTADMFSKAFSRAHALGVKTCVGTETPLTIPAAVRDHLKEMGKDPADPAVVREVYQGMFQRIAHAYPIDYYWLWTPEGWTWGGNSDEALKATIGDIQSALSALDAIGKPFALATCGWVLGPTQDRTALDAVLPKDSPMSCINRSVGHSPVEPGFADIKGRPTWAIPWMENDPVLTAPQPWVGRMRYDAADALRLGCTGLLGIHWRTKILSQNLAALADAAWDQSWAPADFAKPKEAEAQDGPRGGNIVTFTAPVEGTEEDAVYQSVRYNMDNYRLVVPNGTYSVTLKFNEPHYTEAGKRVFGVKIQGSRVIESLDMFGRVGQNKTLDFGFPDIKVTDGALKIDFVRIVEYPCIAGIVIEGQAFSRKINCGGPAYQDYEADNTQLGDNMDRRTMPVEAFYVGFARANFGQNVADRIGRILAGIDGRGLPEPVGWIGGPGGLAVNRAPWSEVKERYTFVDELAAARSNLNGAGNLERFDYWLNAYRGMAAMAELGCLRGELDVRAESIKDETDDAKRKAMAQEALDLRIRMARLWEQMMAYQLATVDTPGEMGTVANLEQHSRKQLKFLNGQDDLLKQSLGGDLPKEVELSAAYAGPARLIVPTVRTQVNKDEALTLKVIVLDKDLPKFVSINWRPLGKGDFRKVEMKNIGRATYQAKLPGAKESFEYYVTADNLVWPAAAPEICQTVVVW